jgi:hypothetical protein
LIETKLGKPPRARVERVHLWRARWGELVQWDTSEHDWLEGRGEEMWLIAMIDDATSKALARFVRHDSTEENLKLLREYIHTHGRPLAAYTDKASLFQTAPKAVHHRQAPEQQPTQIGERCANWRSSGLRPTRPRPRGESSAFSVLPRMGW